MSIKVGSKVAVNFSMMWSDTPEGYSLGEVVDIHHDLLGNASEFFVKMSGQHTTQELTNAANAMFAEEEWAFADCVNLLP
jgi:hypothetical protein